MFQLVKRLPPMKIDEIVSLYKQTGDEQYFKLFLHHYENAINAIAKSWCRKLFMQNSRFDEIKMAMASTYFDCLNKFDENMGVPFLAYAKPFIKASVLEYAAKYSGKISCGGANTFKSMRKVVAILYRLEQAETSKNKIVKTICKETKLSQDRVIYLLQLSKEYSRILSTDEQYLNSKADRYTLIELEDKNSNTENIFFRQMLLDEINEIIDTKLSEKEKMILLDSLGICPFCYKGTNQKTYGEIAEDYDIFSESSIEKTRKLAIKIIRDELQERGIM